MADSPRGLVEIRRAKAIEIFNLIPLLLGKKGRVVHIIGAPDYLLREIRSSCAYKGKDIRSWAQEVESRCPLPYSHPFRRWMNLMPPDDPMRTLGSWAYGAGNSWITIERIIWRDGKVSHPQEEHREWLRKEAAKFAR